VTVATVREEEIGGEIAGVSSIRAALQKQEEAEEEDSRRVVDDTDLGRHDCNSGTRERDESRVVYSSRSCSCRFKVIVWSMWSCCYIPLSGSLLPLPCWR
jgi:hypothetical protein